ncbi:MAG: menaquinone biosynthesis protein [candidate division NC10 bacterium]|nr:menaquinone biosynthesis protein [candidate division NC10 bacterium]
MALRLGRVRYINCEPVYYAVERGLVAAECLLRDGTPAELNDALRAGELDVSVISVMEAVLRPEAYRILPDLAIACDGPVESVLLLCRRPVEALDGLPVILSRHSLTSAYLVKLLLEKSYRVRPRYTGENTETEAWAARLVIGDEALRLAPRHPHRLDLGEAWRALTGLPFVFAVWAARAEVWAAAPEAVRRLHAALLHSKQKTREAPEAMLALAQARTGLSVEACRRYLTERLSFELGPRHLEGLQTFLAMLAGMGVLPAVPTLRFTTD